MYIDTHTPSLSPPADSGVQIIFEWNWTRQFDIIVYYYML